MIYRWREWGEPAKVDSYIKDLVKTDDGLINFTTSFLYKVKSQGIGSYVAKVSWRMNVKNIADFVNLDQIEPRIRKIFSSQIYNELDERKQLAVRTFIDTIDGKIKDPFDDT